VEELSVEAIQKINRKPEKITLYSNYLPVKSNLEKLGVNETATEKAKNNDDDEDSFTLDDVDEDNDDQPREGYFVFILELLGSLAQLAWGGVTALFNASSGSSNTKT
jgi:hypothetical protein